MKNIFIKISILFLLLTIFDIFVPIKFYAFRHWEKFYMPTLLPGSFIPNMHVEGYEFTDRYKSKNYSERIASRKIYTKWKTDDLGFRNDKSKSTIFDSEVIYVGDSNFVGSSFDQEEILSEMHMSQTKIKSYVVAYNLRYILTLIEKSDYHNIKHIVMQSKSSYFNGTFHNLIPFYINNECEISVIHYPHLIKKSNFNLLDFYKSNFANRPFSKFIRSKLGIYNLPENFDKKIENDLKCSDEFKAFNNFNKVQDIKIKYDLIDYNKYHIILQSETEQSLYFKNIMLYLNSYFSERNIKFTMLLLTDENTSEDFKITMALLNSNGKFVYDSNDLEQNGDIWQMGDSHWEVEAARNFVNIILNK